MTPESTTTDEALIEKLKAAPFYQIYQDAFRSATGLPLVLLASGDPNFHACHGSPNQNPFCRSLNSGGDPCARCKELQECLIKQCTDRAQTGDCFAGMKETIIPVRLGGRTVGFLKTGQVLTHSPTRAEIKQVSEALRQIGNSEDQVRDLTEIFVTTPVINEERYAGMMTILSAFALQLATLMNRILLESRHSEPEPVRKAKAFIMDHIDEKLTLDEVASEVHVSTFYLCKIFKQATGMTFTEYVNRQRVELAKNELLKSNRRITEVAYDVGYQSLSQFNRSFLKIVGESPTQYRKRMIAANNDQLVA